jgi:hypothetical protein
MRLGLFYFLIGLPVLVIVVLHREGHLESPAMALAMMAFAFIYHPLVCGTRLIMLGLITKREFWKNFIPGWNNKYFTQLFFYSPKKRRSTDGWSMLKRMALYPVYGTAAGLYFAVLCNAEWLMFVGLAIGFIYWGYREIRLVWEE